MAKRRHHSAKFKFQVALAAAQETKTLSQLASEYELHPSQISEWKQPLRREGTSIFSQQRAWQQREQETRQADLYEQIGRLQMELAWLKKSCRMISRPNGR